MDQTKYIVLYESCQLTKGISRTLLIDSQRNTIEFLDNEIYTILTTQSKSHTIEQILKEFEDEKKETILEYFEFLLEKEYVFLCEATELDFFPEINKTWDHPSVITNSIIDLDRVPSNLNAYNVFISDLDILGCENLQIRDFTGLPLDIIRSILKFTESTGIFRIELILKHNADFEIYETLLNDFPRINELVIHSFPETNKAPEKTSTRLLITHQTMTDASCCGVISPKYFNLDFNHFLESYNYNSCLNRKIGVDVNGYIKNCPSMKENYGSINNERITNIVGQDKFKKAGDLKKNLIEDCQVCEFRHICTDCRAFLESDTSLKKPAKCSYDPYQMIWS